jgi:tRNA pseudouridine38-40 synthase
MVGLPAGLEADRALEALNTQLPGDIRILECAAAPPGFRARDDATSKTYRYVIWNAPECPEARVGRVWHIPSPLDIDAMRAACPAFLGQLDFASFATKPNFKQATTVRHLQHIELRAEAPLLEITMRADGFLYKMVRNIVRAIVKVGEGRTSLAQLNQIIAAKDRSAAPGTAPASGLYLEAVAYDDTPLSAATPRP